MTLLGVGNILVYVILFVGGFSLGFKHYRLEKAHAKNVQLFVKNTQESLTKVMEEFTLRNPNTLADLINNQPTEEDYEKYFTLISEVLSDLWHKSEYLIMNHKEDPTIFEGAILQLHVLRSEYEEQYRQIHATVMNSGIEEKEASRRFAEWVKEGKALPLEDAVIITEDMDHPQPTAISYPVSDNVFTAQIVFMSKEGYAKWLEKKEKAGEEKKALELANE